MRMGQVRMVRSVRMGLPEDVTGFARQYLVPANGIPTLVGNFDPATVMGQLEVSLARLAPGTRATLPPHARRR